MRVRVGDTHIEFEDAIQGNVTSALSNQGGDFIVRRRDHIFAYVFACAVDDGDSTVTRVVRGADLLPTTAQQLFLMDQLGLSRPSYAHVPVLAHADGAKLSKQTSAPAVEDAAADENVRRCLELLGMDPPRSRQNASDWLEWGASRWQPAQVPKSIPSGVH